MIIDYRKAVHPDCGKKYYIHNDIIVTPFWTEEFCQTIIDLADMHEADFKKNIYFKGGEQSKKGIGWHDILMDQISQPLFEEFVKQYQTMICPLLSEVYECGDFVTGWFSPYIIKYDQIGQENNLHNDASLVTLNIKLNNDYQGCELLFPRQQFNSKDVPTGYAMIWPSAVSHPHVTTPLTLGRKLSIVSWTWPPEWSKTGIPNNKNLNAFG
jgi:hypothetical protein